jgi:hypothetical protein
MAVTGFAAVWLLLLGKRSFRALGAIMVEVIIKKISNRNTRSLMDARLNWVSILLFRLSAIFLG